MKRYIYNIVVALLMSAALMPQRAYAGGDISEKTLCFVYIAHSEMTAVSSLTEYLDARYERAKESDDFELVVYLADGDEPFIVKVSAGNDSKADYSALLKELREKRRHEVDPEYDLERILELFEEDDFVKPASDNIRYGAVDWHFHLTSDFWDKGYNESLISSLCFVMGTEYMAQENFRLRCYFSRYDDLSIDEEYPFGKKNYCDIDFRPYYY